MSSVNIFTYGSLTFAPVWQAVVRGRYSAQAAVACGYKRRCITIDDYPVAFRALAGDKLHGRVYFNVNAEDRKRLDHFEGEFYQRRNVTVQLEPGDSIQAQIYLIKPRYRHLISTRPWDPEVFRRRQLKRFVRRYT